MLFTYHSHFRIPITEAESLQPDETHDDVTVAAYFFFNAGIEVFFGRFFLGGKSGISFCTYHFCMNFQSVIWMFTVSFFWGVHRMCASRC